MLVRRDFYNAYKEIQADAASGGPIYIFVSAADCDSCCAFRILKTLLESDNISYVVYAVAGFADLQKRGEALPRDGKERCVVLLNCGVTEDIRQLFSLDELPGTRVFVVDSHRPVHLANRDAANADVLVLCDEREHVPGGEVEEQLDALEAEQRQQRGGEGEESGGSGEDDDEPGPSSQRQRTDAEGGFQPRNSSARRQQQREALRRAHIEYYSRGSFYGRAAGCVLYDMAFQLKKDGLEHYAPLWLAIVAATDQYVHARLSHDAYVATVLEFTQRVADTPGADGPETVLLEDGVVMRAFENRRISYKQEYRLMLLRHWTLYDALLHSPFVATRLQTWKEPGRAALHRLLAEMGVPLRAARDAFRHMSPALQRTLDANIGTFAPQYGLDNLSYWSFYRSHGYTVELSAADLVYAVTALLEAGGAGGAEGDGWQQSFWAAVGALHESATEEVARGLARSKALARAVMAQGGAVLMGKAIRTQPRAYRYFDLADAPHGVDARAAFQQPMALLKLATFVQDALAQRRRDPLPLVVLAPPDENQMQLCVGVAAAAPQLSDTAGNPFAILFRQAAEEAHARFVHDRFEAAVISLAADDVAPFMQALHESAQLLQARADGDDA